MELKAKTATTMFSLPLLVFTLVYLRGHRVGVAGLDEVRLVEEVVDDGVLGEHDVVHAARDLRALRLHDGGRGLQDVDGLRAESHFDGERGFRCTGSSSTDDAGLAAGPIYSRAD
jgi:hypothetical protein